MEFTFKDLMDDFQMYHSQLQQDFFITTRAGLTEYGMYKQALREMYSRYKILKDLYFSREERLVDMEEQEYLSENSEDAFEKKRAAIRYRQIKFTMEDLDLNISETEKEFKRFVEQALHFKNKFGDLPDDEKKKLDEEMWLAKMREMCAVDLITSGRLKNTTYELITSVPAGVRHKVLTEIKDNKTGLIEWYENREDIIISDKIPKIDFSDSLKLLEE